MATAPVPPSRHAGADAGAPGSAAVADGRAQASSPGVPQAGPDAGPDSGPAARPDPILAAFLDQLRDARGLSAHTVIAYRRDLTQLRAGFEGSWSELQTADLRRMAAGLARAGRHPRTIQRFLSAARSFGQWAVGEGLLAHNPAAALRGPKLGRPLPRVLDVDQAAQAMQGPGGGCAARGSAGRDPAGAAIPGSAASGLDPRDLRDRAILELFYSSGLRLSELTGLDLGGLDLQAGLVRVLGKGRRERSVPVGRRAREALRAWLAVRSDWVGPEEPALFVSRRGRLSNRAVQSRLAQAGVQAGLPERLHPHRLRHAFASHLLESSGDLRAVQELLGHADLATTQIYTHLDFQHLAQVYDQAHPRARRKSPGTGGNP